jgi:Secretion system C-terminal sorting domain
MKKKLLTTALILGAITVFAQNQKKQDAINSIKEFSWLCNQNKPTKNVRSTERLINAKYFAIPYDSTEMKFSAERNYFYKITNNFFTINSGNNFANGNILRDVFQLNGEVYQNNIIADSIVSITQIEYPNITDSTVRLMKYDILNRLIGVTIVSFSNPTDSISLTENIYSGINLYPDSIKSFTKNSFGNLEYYHLIYNSYLNNKLHSSTRYEYINTPSSLKLGLDTFNFNSNGTINSQISKLYMSMQIPGTNTSIIIDSSYSKREFYYDTVGDIDSLFSGEWSYVNNAYTNPIAVKYNYNSTKTEVATKKYWTDQLTNTIQSKMAEEYTLDAQKNIIKVMDNSDSLRIYRILRTYTALGNLSTNIFTEYSPAISSFTTWDSVINTYTAFTPLSSIQIENYAPSFSVFPNPNSTDNLNLYYTSNKAQLINLDIIDATGRILQSQKINLINGNSILPIDIKNLSVGNYFVIIKDDKQFTKSIQFVKQ